MENKRDQLEKKGSRRFKGPASRMRHSTIAKVTPATAREPLSAEAKPSPARRTNRTKSLLLTKPSSGGWKRSMRGGFEKHESKSKMAAVGEEEDDEEFDLEEEEKEAAREIEQENNKDEKERRFDSWLHEVLDEEESTKNPRRGLDKSKSRAAVTKAESILGLGETKDEERRGSGLNDGWLGDFLSEGYHKVDKSKNKKDEMQLDFSILENYSKDATSTDFTPETSAVVSPLKSSASPTSRSLPHRSAAAIEQSKRNLALEKYIEESTHQLLNEHSHDHHQHHRHDGHHGHQARKHKTTKPELGRDTTT